MRRTPLALIAVAMTLVSCSPTGSPPSTTATTSTTPPTPSTTAAPTTTTAPTPTTTPSDDLLVVPLALNEMPETWEELFFIPYGETSDTLGTSPGGDGGSIDWGPEYGAQAPDGSWWFLDAAKFRLAHFSESGDYLDEVVLPESLLAGGIYFQYQLPRILSDGTLLATTYPGGGTTFLRLRGDQLDSFSIGPEMMVQVDDGSLLYGASSETGAKRVVDPAAGTTEPVDFYRSRGGDRFRITSTTSGLRIELPDAPVNREVTFEAGEIGGPVYVGLATATGSDGTIHLFLFGYPANDESQQLVGYMTVSASGEVSGVEPMRNPFTLSDPGSPGWLGVRPGTNDVTYMVIDTDGVRVYGRR